MGKGGGGGPSASEMMDMQRTLNRETYEMQQQGVREAEIRAEERREQERLDELERRRTAELERAEAMKQEELREQGIMAEAEGGQQEEDLFNNLNLEAPQIESPDYAPRTELE